MADRTVIREYLDHMANIAPDDWTTDQHAEAISLLWEVMKEPAFPSVKFEPGELLEAGPMLTLNINVESDPSISTYICKLLDQELQRSL